MSLQSTALNNMIAGYLEDVEFNYSLTVFREEATLSPIHVLSDHDLMEVLHIGHGSFLHTALTAAKGQGGLKGTHMGRPQTISTCMGVEWHQNHWLNALGRWHDCIMWKLWRPGHPRSFLERLLSAVSLMSEGGSRGSEIATQTIGGER